MLDFLAIPPFCCFLSGQINFRCNMARIINILIFVVLSIYILPCFILFTPLLPFQFPIFLSHLIAPTTHILSFLLLSILSSISISQFLTFTLFLQSRLLLSFILPIYIYIWIISSYFSIHPSPPPPSHSPILLEATTEQLPLHVGEEGGLGLTSRSQLVPIVLLIRTRSFGEKHKTVEFLSIFFPGLASCRLRDTLLVRLRRSLLLAVHC